jgi:hypothetical protein
MKGPMKLWLSRISFARFRRKTSREIPSVEKDVEFPRKSYRFHFNRREMSILAGFCFTRHSDGVKDDALNTHQYTHGLYTSPIYLDLLYDVAT